MARPHLGLVAEDGAESIIPLSLKRRSRGIELWQKTGQLLGVQPYANGGIVGSISAVNPDNSREFSSDNNQDGQQERAFDGVSPIQIQLEVNPQFVIQAGQSGGNRLDEDAIVAMIRAHIREMADDIGDELAERLVRIFENMPLRGGR